MGWRTPSSRPVDLKGIFPYTANFLRSEAGTKKAAETEAATAHQYILNLPYLNGGEGTTPDPLAIALALEDQLEPWELTALCEEIGGLTGQEVRG